MSVCASRCLCCSASSLWYCEDNLGAHKNSPKKHSLSAHCRSYDSVWSLGTTNATQFTKSNNISLFLPHQSCRYLQHSTSKCIKLSYLTRSSKTCQKATLSVFLNGNTAGIYVSICTYLLGSSCQQSSLDFLPAYCRERWATTSPSCSEMNFLNCSVEGMPAHSDSCYASSWLVHAKANSHCLLCVLHVVSVQVLPFHLKHI